MKKSISLKSHHLDVPSAEDWDFLGRLLKSITLGLDKDGVGPVTLMQFRYAQNTIEVELEFMDLEQKDL